MAAFSFCLPQPALPRPSWHSNGYEAPNQFSSIFALTSAIRASADWPSSCSLTRGCVKPNRSEKSFLMRHPDGQKFWESLNFTKANHRFELETRVLMAPQSRAAETVALGFSILQ